MDRAELIKLAAPPCHRCGEPIKRVEQSWIRNGEGDWVPGDCFMVCGAEHRVLVELLESR